MKAFTNLRPRDVRQAVSLAEESRRGGRAVAYAGGGSDLLALVKERIVSPDVIVSLKGVSGATGVSTAASGVAVGGLTTLSALGADQRLRREYAVLAEAAESVATPQIRNVATLAGNVCQRPWCWYYRNAFPCFKNGGQTCFSASGENQFNAIFGGGPSYIVHPSDTAPALVALDAAFTIQGPKGTRVVPAREFFVLPRQVVTKENVLADNELVVSATLPPSPAGRRSAYHKVLDREAWTHAVVSAAVVLDMDGDTCRSARVVLGGVAPIPWRLEAVEKLLTGARITPELADRAGELAVADAMPLPKNRYKVPLTRTMVRRTIADLAARG
jgi:xanthine dehydrogenase YagS FAD-binding subunit